MKITESELDGTFIKSGKNSDYKIEKLKGGGYSISWKHSGGGQTINYSIVNILRNINRGEWTIVKKGHRIDNYTMY